MKKNVERDKHKQLWETMVWETIKETNLSTDFYCHKYYFILKD